MTLADVAPTQAKLLHFGFDAPDGKAIPEVPGPAPRLAIITLVWDAGGLSLLDAFPEDYRVLRSMIPKGSVRPRERRFVAVDHAGDARHDRDRGLRYTPARPTPSSVSATTWSARGSSGPCC